MRLILVRHGDAYAGLRGVIAGPQGCRGLTELGRLQAAALRDRIAESGRPAVDRLVTSLLPRAIETANIIAVSVGADEVRQDCDLCEVHTGDADGMEWDEYSERFGAIDMHREPDRPFAPGGDSWHSFHTRVDAVMTRLAHDHPDETVMAVCHAGVIAASLRVRFDAALTGGPRLTPTNTSLTEWDFDAATGQWTLRSYNDARHLDAIS